MNEVFAVPEDISEATDASSRLRLAVGRAGGNKAVAERSGIPLSTLTTYLAGRDMKAMAAAKLAKTCGVSLDWLLIGADGANSLPQMSQSQTIAAPAMPDVVEIPYYDVEASAGFGRLATNAPPPEKFPLARRIFADLGISPAHTIIIRVAGDSMEPTLKSGDRIIVSTARGGMLDGINVMVSYGQLMVKRLATTPTGMISVISDNKEYRSEDVSITKFHFGPPEHDDQISIIGRVIYRLHAL